MNEKLYESTKHACFIFPNGVIAEKGPLHCRGVSSIQYIALFLANLRF